MAVEGQPAAEDEAGKGKDPGAGDDQAAAEGADVVDVEHEQGCERQ